jgi:hypothetical protein
VIGDWRINLESRDPDGGCGTLEIVSGDQSDAINALEGWAETIDSIGYVPDSLEWRNGAGCAIVRRMGKLRYQVRCDTFEREGSNGTGYLVARYCP